MVREVRELLLHIAHKKGEQSIGATITLLALLTASATLAGHRAHTEEVKAQTVATDQWGFYQAKHIRAHMYGIEAEKALASGKEEMRKLAKKYLAVAIYEQCGTPATDSCHVENCRTADGKGTGPDPKKPCTVPVLKDSPELEAFFQANLLSDQTFHDLFFHSAIVRKGDSPGENFVAMAQKGPDGTSEPPNKKPGGAADIIQQARSHNREVDNSTNEAVLYDIAEVVLEVSIMICSFALVVGTKSYRKAAYLTTVVAMTVATTGVGVSLFALRYPVEKGVPGATYGAAALVLLSLIGWVWLYAQQSNEPRLEKIAASPEPLA